MHSYQALIVVVVCSLLLSACGGGSSSGRSGGGVNSQPPVPPPATNPPPSDPPPDVPTGDYSMPPLVTVLAPETDFDAACASGIPPGEPSAPVIKGDTTTADSGILVDAAVSGVAYRTASLQGVTNAEGRFHFQAGEALQFALGDTALGKVSGMSQVTPFDLAGSNIPTGLDAIDSALQDTTHPFHRAINTAVLLQSLDEDGDPGNGIAIAPETATLLSGVSLELSQGRDSFAREYSVAAILGAANAKGLFSVPHGLVNPAPALNHLYSTLGIDAHVFGISLEEVDWDGDGMADDSRRFHYDDAGNLVGTQYKYFEGSQQSEENWTYDERGNLIGYEMREFGERSAETSVYLENGLLWKHETDSDDNGLIDSTQTWSYRHNPDGSLKEATMLNREDHEEEVTGAVASFQYNAAGDPSRIEFSGDNLHLAADQLGLPGIPYLEYAKTYVISYEYGADGKLVADTLDGQNPQLGYNILSRRYDSLGNATYSEGRFMQGTGNEEQLSISEYRHDSDGRVIREAHDRDANGEIDEIGYHSYDQHGARSRSEWDHNADGDIDHTSQWPYVYQYYDSGQIMRRTLESNGEIQEVIGYAWHPNGTLAQEDRWSTDVEVFEVSTWLYNDAGQLLREQIDHDGDGLPDRVTNYHYDDCGGLVSRESSGEDEEQSSEAWQYDASGKLRHHNWSGAVVTPTIPHSPLPQGFPVFASAGFERWQYGDEGKPRRYQFECHGECVIFSGGREAELTPLPNQTINWEYDEADRVSRELVDENGDGQAERVTVFEYDHAGRVTRKLVDTSASGTANEVTRNQYDDSGRLLRHDIDENGDGIIDYVANVEYDAHGNVLSRYTDEDNDGNPEELTTFLQQYDSDGNRTRQEVDLEGDNSVDEIYQWTYNAEGTLLSLQLEEKHYSETWSVETWQYNSHGKPVTREYDEDSNGVPEEASTYEYDAHGNLLRQINGYSFDGDGIMEETETMEYVPTGWGHLFHQEGGI